MDLSEEGSQLASPQTSQKRRRYTVDEVRSSNGILTPIGSDVDQARSKRIRQVSSPVRDDTSENTDEEDPTTKKNQDKDRTARRELSHIAVTGPAYPRSAYQGWKPPLPPTSEDEAVSSLRNAFESHYENSDEKPNYTFFQLDNFSIYRADNAAKHEGELVALHLLSQDRYPEFFFDGTLSVSEEKHYVEHISFQVLTLDGYGEPDSTDMTSQMCIQSRLGTSKDVWYKLGASAVEYQRFYRPFVWLARFTKHFVDYLSAVEQVTLAHFRARFFQWLYSQYKHEDAFHKWLAESKLKDFRSTVAANVGFLRKETYSIDPKLWGHPIWAETNPQGLSAIPEQPHLEDKTVVTPYAYECFKSMYFKEHLVERRINQDMLNIVNRRKRQLQLAPRYVPSHESVGIASLLTPMSVASDDLAELENVEAGDVVCVRPDVSTNWGPTEHPWFVYVQQVRQHDTRTLLDVLWLYEPKDTTMGTAQYPFGNELFMSDNCSCGKDAIDLDCVIEKVSVAWYARDPYAQRGLFVRQKFRTIHQEDTYDFLSLQTSDFACRCRNHVPIFEECRSKYAIGDTVLVREWCDKRAEDRLQPAQIVEFLTAKRRVQLRRLLRRTEAEPGVTARPNELIITKDVYDKACDKIIRKCHVRYFNERQIARGLVTPYDRDGTGDFFFIAGQDPEPLIKQLDETLPMPDENGDLLYSNDNPALPAINQGWDPKGERSNRKLAGMGIFCGGGTFDRGLEEGGAVSFRYAVDWAEHALHSHRANVDDPADVQYFLGSVNDCLARAMSGARGVALPGDVDLISAGSPCPGFSSLQPDKLSEGSKRNASMVASVVSFVDFYVPEYFVLENVVKMTSSMLVDGKKQNVFSQIIAALVGLGYQVQQFLMDAWSFGSSQQRSRVFIVASAPGLAPLNHPPHSHGHPSRGFTIRALGKSSNGLYFGTRKNHFTTFPQHSAAESVSDLPNIYDAQVQLCPAYPDHRTANTEPAVNRTRMAMVPTRPHGMGLIQAKLAGLLRGEPVEHCETTNKIRSKADSRMFARVYPNFLFPTITTKLQVHCGINGRCVHWSQPRTLTVMEARRAQGYLDHEVVIGNTTEQLKIVGNSVDRKVALMLGLAIRESWIGEDRQREAVESDALVPAAEYIEDKPIWNSDDEDDLQGGNTPVSEERDSDEQKDSMAQPVAPPQQDPTIQIDNRSAKIALQLSPDQIEEVKRDHFKAIRRILEERRAS